MSSNIMINMKKLMVSREVNASALSAVCGVDKGNISRIISGKTPNPKIETLKAIAHFFDITIDQLIGDAPIDIDESCGRVVPINRLVIPVIDWNNASYWLQINNQFISRSSISVESEMSKLSYALVIDNDDYQPIFMRNEVIAVDPTLTPGNWDYFIHHDYAHKKTTIRQMIMKNNIAYSKSVMSQSSQLKQETDLSNSCGVIIESHKNLKAGNKS